MSLPFPHRHLAIAAVLVGAACSSGVAESADASVIYRCPGNEYKNTISAKEAEKLGCRKLEGAQVTIIQGTRPARRRRAGGGRRLGRARRPGRPARARHRCAPHPRRRAAQRGRQARRDGKGVQRRPARAPGRREELSEVPRPGRARCAPRSPASRPTSPPSVARSRSCRRRWLSDRAGLARVALVADRRRPRTPRSTCSRRSSRSSRPKASASSSTPRSRPCSGCRGAACRADLSSTGSAIPRCCARPSPR